MVPKQNIFVFFLSFLSKMNLFLLFFSISFISSTDIIEIPFTLEGKHPLDNTDNDYPKLNEKLIYSSEISIGSNNQRLSVTVDMQSTASFIISDENDKEKYPEIIPFIKNNSFTLSCENEIKNESLLFTKAKLCNDSFILNEKRIKNIQIYIADEISSYVSKRIKSGLISLNKPENTFRPNFIKNLKEFGLIDSFSFSVEMEDDLRKGKFVIGKIPSEYNEKYDKNNFLIAHAYLDSYLSTWQFELKYIKYGEKFVKNMSTNLRIEFNLNEWLIKANKDFNETIYSEFFKNLIQLNQCEYYDYVYGTASSDHRYVYACKKDTDLSQFKDITFYNDEFKYYFTFSKEDLFFTYKDKKIFYITFDTFISSSTWIFGGQFLKKFGPFCFNQESKTIGFYKKEKPKEEERKKTNWIIIFLISFIGVSLVIISLLIYYSYSLRKKIKPKKKAIEFLLSETEID